MIPALLLAAFASAAEPDALGGHAPEMPERPAAEAVAEERRVSVLEEMWARRILNPDQNAWAPSDAELLTRIRASEADALEYLKRKFGRTRPFTAPRRDAGVTSQLLTKDGYAKYLFHLSQDALEYFESKGADAKWALKLTDWEGGRLFDQEGRLTPIGQRVYRRAKLKLEVYWKSPNGETFGTRRPPAAHQPLPK